MEEEEAIDIDKLVLEEEEEIDIESKSDLRKAGGDCGLEVPQSLAGIRKSLGLKTMVIVGEDLAGGVAFLFSGGTSKDLCLYSKVLDFQIAKMIRAQQDGEDK